MPKLVALLLRLRLPVRSVLELRGDFFLPRIDRRQDRLVEKSLQQPDQNQEIDRLRENGETVDEHAPLSARRRDDMIPERICKNENHPDQQTIKWQRIDHG